MSALDKLMARTIQLGGKTTIVIGNDEHGGAVATLSTEVNGEEIAHSGVRSMNLEVIAARNTNQLSVLLDVDDLIDRHNFYLEFGNMKSQPK